MGKKNKIQFSVLLSVYFKENPVFLEKALESLFKQTLLMDEIVLVKDGVLSCELNTIIDNYVKKYPNLIKVVTLEKNVGLGKALNFGLEYCSNEIVARMDTDDICYPDRFERQIHFLKQNQEISVVGGSIQEFNERIGDLNQIRRLPFTNKELLAFSKYRNPLNHPTVMFKKSHILSVGSYQDMLFFEDYYLWVRLLKKGYMLANIQEPILHFRVGNDMIGRRKGLKYALLEMKFLKKIREIKYISNKEYIISILTKIPLRFFPKKILKLLYKKLLR